MKLKSLFLLFLSLLLIPMSVQIIQERVIIRSELRDKILGEWIGQMTGAYFGLPFELLYFKDPVPFEVNKFYTARNKMEVKINDRDTRGNLEVTMSYLDGGLSSK